MGCLMIRLKDILLEIGSRIVKPKGVKVQLKNPEFGATSVVTFTLDGDKYVIDIKPLMVMPDDSGNLVIGYLKIDFDIEGEFKMANKGNALEVFSNIMGGVQEFFDELTKEYPNTTIRGIRWDAKTEFEGDERRDKIYRIMIQKWAKSNGYSGKIVAGGGSTQFMFEPPVVLG